MGDKLYRGWRDEHGVHVTVNDEPLRHIPFHSPGGFEWSYAGSGTADLALALLADYLDEVDEVIRFLNCRWDVMPPASWHYHQKFKSVVVARWPRDG